MEIHVSAAGSDKVEDISQFTGNPDGEIDGCRITFGGKAPEKADAWFVIEDLARELDVSSVPKGQLHFLSAETAWGSAKFISPANTAFLRQFDKVHTFYRTKARRKHFAAPFLPWMVNANHQTVFRPHHRDVQFFRSLQNIKKTQPLSMFCSDQQWRPGHRRRFAFAQAAKRYFGDDLHWFGNGVNEIEEKWDGLAPYRRTIVLENNDIPGVFSEKVMDPYLTLTEPFYSGGPGISASFPIRPEQLLDLSDFQAAIHQVARIIDTELTDPNVEALHEGKMAVLDRHHFLKRICTIAQNSKPRAVLAFRPRPVRSRSKF